MMHTDIPTSNDIHELATSRHPASVTIYLPTSAIATESEVFRLELKRLAGEAVTQLRAAGNDKADIDSIEESLLDLIDDSIFWSYMSETLAVFVTPLAVRSLRLPNRLVAAVEVSDRFYIKPLMRATTFSQAAIVLALAQNSVRVIQISADAQAETVSVPDMPVSITELVNRSGSAGRSPSGRMQGSEGHKVRMRQYARAIDSALRSTLAGRDTPLILAGSEPLLSIYQSVSTAGKLAEETILGSPEHLTDTELDQLARPIMDRLHGLQVKDAQDMFTARVSEGRTAVDLGDIARAATNGAVDTVFVDIDESISGSIDETTGVVRFDEKDDAINYGVVDEIVRRVLVARGRVLAVRADDVPGHGAAAAILRYVN